MSEAAHYRREAARCRALAGTCLYHAPRDALRELAAEYDAKAQEIEAKKAKRGKGCRSS